MLGSIFVPQGSVVALSLLIAAAIAVDSGVQANLVFGYRAIFALAPETPASAKRAMPFCVKR